MDTVNERPPTQACLAAGEILRLEAPRGLVVACESGHLWITEESQPDDVWLAPGQRVRLVGEGLALLEAKGDACLRITGYRHSREGGNPA